MYLKKFFAKNKLSFGLNKFANKNFSILSNFNKNTLAFRATKYDPTQQLEVFFKFLKKIQNRIIDL